MTLFSDSNSIAAAAEKVNPKFPTNDFSGDKLIQIVSAQISAGKTNALQEEIAEKIWERITARSIHMPQNFLVIAKSKLLLKQIDHDLQKRGVNCKLILSENEHAGTAKTDIPKWIMEHRNSPMEHGAVLLI